MQDVDMEMEDIPIDFKPTLTITGEQNGSLQRPFFERQCTIKGCELEGSHLSWSKRLVRAAVSFVVPAGSYQTRVSEDAVDFGPQTVIAAGGKRVSVKANEEYEIDNYIAEYNCRPPTLFIPIITAAEVAVFAYYAATTIGGVTATSGAPLDSPLIFNPSRRYEAWRFLTYMFIHQGYFHLIFNLLVQLLLGIPLELVHKWWRVGIVYCLGVIAGSTVHTVFDRYTLLAGASGGVYALIGAHLAIIVMNWREMTHEWMGSIMRVISSGPFRLSLWIFFVLADTSVALYTRYAGDGENSTSYMAHIGGALVGFLVGIPVLRNINAHFWEDVLWYIALIVYVLILIFVVCWNCFYPDYPTTDWRDCCPPPIITNEKIEDD